MSSIKEQRAFLRVGIKQLTSIVQKRGGDYELIKGDQGTKAMTIRILDISSGGLCIESKKTLKVGVKLELVMPEIMHLESNALACEVTRSVFREDPRAYLNMGTTKDKSYYEIGLKFKIPNTNYLNQLFDLAQAKKI